MFPGDVISPVRFEVPVGVDGAELQNGFSAILAPPRSGHIKTIGDEVTAPSFDHPAGDGPAGGEIPVVVLELGVRIKVVGTTVGAAALVGGQPGLIGLGFDGVSDLDDQAAPVAPVAGLAWSNMRETTWSLSWTPEPHSHLARAMGRGGAGECRRPGGRRAGR